MRGKKETFSNVKIMSNVKMFKLTNQRKSREKGKDQTDNSTIAGSCLHMQDIVHMLATSKLFKKKKPMSVLSHFLRREYEDEHIASALFYTFY